MKHQDKDTDHRLLKRCLVEIRRRCCTVTLEHAESTIWYISRRTLDTHFDMIARQRELDPAALPDTRLLPDIFRDGDLSLAGYPCVSMLAL